MDRELNGKTAVVAGASGTLGGACAEALAQAGARLVLLGRSTRRLDQLAARLEDGGCTTWTRRCDLGQEAQLSAMAAWISEEVGGLDILVNCAGVSEVAAVLDNDQALLERLWQANVNGPILLTRHLGRLIRRGGAIVLLGSTAGLRPIEDYSAYTTTKAATAHFAQAAALELSRQGVRVNCVCPGVVPSGIHSSTALGDEELFYETMRRSTPLGRLGRPEDVARAALFLASDAAGWITGAVLAVDGGLALI